MKISLFLPIFAVACFSMSVMADDGNSTESMAPAMGEPAEPTAAEPTMAEEPTAEEEEAPTAGNATDTDDEEPTAEAPTAGEPGAPTAPTASPPSSAAALAMTGVFLMNGAAMLA